MDDTQIKLPFGCTKGLPEGVQVAWGARMIAPNDLLWDRQGCAGGEEGGPERVKLLNWLGQGAGNAAREFCLVNRIGMGSSIIADGSSHDIIPLYEDEHGKIVGSPQGSHGYVYIAAWLKEAVA
jgi:hypothetical protein